MKDVRVSVEFVNPNVIEGSDFALAAARLNPNHVMEYTLLCAQYNSYFKREGKFIDFCYEAKQNKTFRGLCILVNKKFNTPTYRDMIRALRNLAEIYRTVCTTPELTVQDADDYVLSSLLDMLEPSAVVAGSMCTHKDSVITKTKAVKKTYAVWCRALEQDTSNKVA